VKNILTIAIIMSISISCSNAQNNNRTKVQINTTEGTIVVELYNETPVHRDNFIKLVEEKFYDNTLFHRCIQAFMIQGGDPNSRDAKPGEMLGSGDVGYTLPAEFLTELFVHTRGALAAARQGDQVNPEKRSSGCQFYIVQGRTFTQEQMEEMNEIRSSKYTPEQIEAYTTVGGTPHLDNGNPRGGYTVFGHVVSGLDVVEKISLLPRDQNNRPMEDVRVKSMKIIK
jgi:peptidyl-prolyl cis-trans isomerase B (cyclophilin B)